MPPLAHPEKVICVGLNYRDHSAENGFKQPDFPTLSGRFKSSLIGHGAPILRPEQSFQLDYVSELVAVICGAARDVSEGRAFGPGLVTADDPPPGCEGLRLETCLHGQAVQSAPISEMGFPVATLVSILSSFRTLKPEDVIVTKTPSGVGVARKPQLSMKYGDVCEVEIEKIGILSNPVRDRK